MKNITIMIIALLLSACATADKQVVTFDSQGKPFQTSTTMRSKDVVKMRSVMAAESARTECYKSRKSDYEAKSDLGQVALMLASQQDKVDCGNGYNEVLIAKEQGKTERWKTGFNGVLGLAKFGAGGYVAGKLIDGIGSRTTNTTNVSGESSYTDNSNSNETIVDNESSYNGAQGDGASYSENNPTGLQVEPVTLGLADTEEPTEETETETETTTESAPVTDEASCLAAGGTPIKTPSGTYIRCSDGVGGDL